MGKMRKPIHEFDKYTDLKDMLKISGEKYGDRPAYMIRTDKKGEFKTITHKEFREEINALGTKLINMGLKDKRIAVIGENRYEWGVAYLATVTRTGRTTNKKTENARTEKIRKSRRK